jgi:hypothetical protein
MVKKVLSIFVWSLTGIGLILLFVFSRSSYLNTPLKDINISIERKHEKGFVKKSIMLDNVKKLCDADHNKTIGQIDLVKIDEILENNPWTESSSAYVDLDGTLNVVIKEYEAVMRAYNNVGNSVYLTENGKILPDNVIYTPRVLIASGNLSFPKTTQTVSIHDSIFHQSGLTDIYQIYKEIEKDAFLKACIGQVYRMGNKEYEITLNQSETRVILGDTSNLNDKLLRLKLFYKQKGGTEELAQIRKINLKYKNQIVCTKY